MCENARRNLNRAESNKKINPCEAPKFLLLFAKKKSPFILKDSNPPSEVDL